MVSSQDCVLLQQRIIPEAQKGPCVATPGICGCEPDREVLDKVQRRAIKVVSNLRQGTGKENLGEAGMMSLVDRRERDNMITTY